MYRIFDILIESNIPIPELPEVDQGEVSISFLLSPDSFSDEEQLKWYHHWRLPNREITISCARMAEDYFLRFPELADFWISQKGDQIRCFAMPSASNESIRHLLVDQVIPRVIAHQGWIVLHASAIEMEGRIIAFLGESGWGKSTLAISFYEQGFPLLTDDSLLLKPKAGKFVGIPSYAGSRLWSDSLEAVVNDKSGVHPVAHYSSKKRLIFPESLKRNVFQLPLTAIFVLASPDELRDLKEVTIEPLKGAQMIMELVKHSFHLDVTDRDIISDQFKVLGQMINTSLPIYRLSYPRDHALLENVRKIVQKVVLKSSTERSRTS